MSYFAAAAVRIDDRWTASELDLRGITDVEDAADRLRDVEPDADLTLLFVEADDEYLVVLRLDEGADLRVFGSDAGYSEESALGSALLGDLEPGVPEFDLDDESEPTEDDDEDKPASDPDSNPVGDADLLADLGIPDVKLLALCSRDGMLPSEVTTAICETLGFADEVEELR